jgi:Ca2+-binding EF-hand superfamily protein
MRINIVGHATFHAAGWLALPTVLFGSITVGAAESAPQRHDFLASVRRLEFVEMLSAIVNGDEIGPGAGWFHPAQSRYNWKLLAERMDADHDGAITPEEFTGPRELFDRLDRDGDGRLTAADFDWSDKSPYWRQAGMAKQLLRRADADDDGKVSEEEWREMFRKAAKGKDKLTADDLRLLLFPPPPKAPPGPPPDMPSMPTLLLGLFQSEIGSPSAGPKVGAPAPDFTLRTPDGKKISMQTYRAGRPMVLVFGSFT